MGFDTIEINLVKYLAVNNISDLIKIHFVICMNRVVEKSQKPLFKTHGKPINPQNKTWFVFAKILYGGARGYKHT